MANLMGNALARQPFCDDPNHDAKHGCAAVKAFNPLELLPMEREGDRLGSPAQRVGPRSVGRVST
jgi:hypothetical protein